MSTISCPGCGMEYDGTGLQAGVQFKCTQCGGMVKVGAPAPRAPRGGRTPAGRPVAGGGPAPRGGSRGRPAAGSPVGQMRTAQQQPAYGPPRKSSNTGVIVGVIVGIVVLGLIIAAVVMASGPAPEDIQKQQQAEELKRKKEETAKKDAEVAAENELRKKPIEAAMAQAQSIETALRGGDAAALERMFDWQVYASYNADWIKANWGGAWDYKEAALLCVGDWEKDADGAPTGKFIGKSALGAGGLRDRVMYYIKEFYFGREDIRWEKARTEAHAGYTVTAGGTTYWTKPIFISFSKGGTEKEFWFGAPKGSSDVRIVNFIDKDAFKKLQEKEAPRQRKDDRNFMRDPGSEPERDPAANPEGDPGTEEAPANPDDDLPNVAKIGSMPTVPALVNGIKELQKPDGKLNAARVEQVVEESNKQEKKAAMGAMIDLLIDAVNGRERNRMLNISTALYECFRFLVYVEWKKEDMVYLISFDGQSESDTIVRRWIRLYNEYQPK